MANRAVPQPSRHEDDIGYVLIQKLSFNPSLQSAKYDTTSIVDANFIMLRFCCALPKTNIH